MRYFLEISYNGGAYHGWQIQKSDITVQSVVEEVLSKILKTEVGVVASGRTDAGVHANQQVVHFDTDNSLDEFKFIQYLNALLPNDIVGYSLKEVYEDKSARFDAEEREYKYYIKTRKDPFHDGLVTFLHKTPSVELLNQASELLLGEQDFQCFSKVHTEVNHFRCNINFAFWEHKEHTIVFTIRANRFLRGMVRAIVGTLLDIGFGKHEIMSLKEVIDSRNRNKAGMAAPPQGLYLNKITYPSNVYK